MVLVHTLLLCLMVYFVTSTLWTLNLRLALCTGTVTCYFLNSQEIIGQL